MRYFVADFGMNMYEGGLFDLESRLESVRALGFSGLERLEANNTEGAVRNAALFHRMGLDFCTTRGPSPELGFLWTAAFGTGKISLQLRFFKQKKYFFDFFMRPFEIKLRAMYIYIYL